MYNTNFPYMFYIGSTKNTIKKRFQKHIERSKNNNDLECYKFLNNFAWDDVEIRVLCEQVCVNDEARFKLEQFYIDLYDPPLNMVNAFLTDEERQEMKRTSKKNWYETKGKLYHKNWRASNKEKLIEYERRYQEKHPGKRQETIKKSCEKHKEQRNQRAIEWHKTNHDKYKCDACDYKTYCKTHYTNHLLTKRHLKKVGSQ